jgi:H+/gluconate symporter-like permease
MAREVAREAVVTGVSEVAQGSATVGMGDATAAMGETLEERAA